MRSQRGRQRWTWKRKQRLVRKHLFRIFHLYPDVRFRARLKGGAVSGNPSHTDLHGGRPERVAPTAIDHRHPRAREIR